MDMLILATSRPQGYNEDFSPETYDHRWLVPLPLKKALEYGTKLAHVRFAGDSDRIQKIVGKLRRASTTPATARIMRSPLQVTILTLLVDRRGQLPQEHWTLFHEYYTMIYNRETERDIPAAAILREKKDDIDAVHRLVGLLLQVENEKSGRTDARLTTAQFGEIVEKYLASEGNEGRALIELRDAIIEGAYIRLVFLVGLETGTVGFEIRPLQEFMAAECLLDTDDGLVQSRLRAVAGNGNWRNVILFAVGKIFTDRRYLRDTVESICTELNENTSDPASHLVYAGSELALDLLEDGPVARQPAKSRSLTRLALKLLELDGSTWPRRLAGIYQENTRDIFEEELSRAFSSLHAKTRSNTWICLAVLIEAGADHLISLTGRALANSPPDAEAAVEMMATSAGSVPEWLADVMAKTLPSINPADMQRAGYRNMRIYLQRGARPNRRARSDWLDAAWEWASPLRHFDKTKTLRIVDVGTNRLVGETSLTRIDRTRSSRLRSIVSIPSDCHVGWELIRQIAAFEDSPTKSRLVEVLRTASTFSSSEASFLITLNFTAWPLNECLLAGFWDTDWPALIEAVESGLLGDRADWERWENAWVAEGLKLTDVCSDISHVLESGVANPWFPLRAGSVYFGGARWVDMSFIEETVSGTTNRVRQVLATAIARGAFRSRLHGERVEELPPAFVEALLEVANSPSWQVLGELMANTRWSPPLDELWVSAISKGAQKSALVGHYMIQSRIGGWLISALRKFPEYHGLLVAIAQFGDFKIEDDDIYRISRLSLDGKLAVIRLSRAVIMLRAGRSLADVRTDVDAVFGDAHADTELLFDALLSEDAPVDRQIAELLTVRKLATSSPVREALALSALRTSLRRRQSDLIDERRWIDLGFMNSLRDVMRSADA